MGSWLMALGGESQRSPGGEVCADLQAKRMLSCGVEGLGDLHWAWGPGPGSLWLWTRADRGAERQRWRRPCPSPRRPVARNRKAGKCWEGGPSASDSPAHPRELSSLLWGVWARVIFLKTCFIFCSHPFCRIASIRVSLKCRRSSGDGWVGQWSWQAWPLLT